MKENKDTTALSKMVRSKRPFAYDIESSLPARKLQGFEAVTLGLIESSETKKLCLPRMVLKEESDGVQTPAQTATEQKPNLSKLRNYCLMN